MRKTAISDDIKGATDLKTLSLLSLEIKDLLFKCLKTDKRKLRSETDKAHFRGKLELYCKLYKTCRSRFLEIKKKTKDNSNYYKIPLEFDDLIIDFNWERTIKYSVPASNKVVDTEELDTDEEAQIEPEKKESEYVTLNQLSNEYLTKIVNKMKKEIFNRQDPAVKQAAAEKSLTEFLAQFDGQTSNEILTKVYQELNKGKEKTLNDKIHDRVGSEETTEPLVAEVPAGDIDATDPAKLLSKTVSFTHAGQQEIGVVYEYNPENQKYKVKDKKGFKYPLLASQLTVIPADGEVTEMTTVEVEVTTTTTVDDDFVTLGETTTTTTAVVVPGTDGGTPFTSLTKEEKDVIVKEYFDSGLTGCSAIKKKMVTDGYTIVYDDIFYSFERVKKAAQIQKENTKTEETTTTTIVE